VRREWLIAAILLLLDQSTKLAVKGIQIGPLVHPGMQLGESIPVLGEWVRITFVENPGIAFGFSVGGAKVALTLFSLAVSLVLGWILSRLPAEVPFWARLGVVLLFAGATGNLIDRAFYGVLYGEAPLLQGNVVDFIDVEFPDFTLFGRHYTRWPAFNVADACITVGILLLLLFHRHLPPLRQLLRQRAR
jgi:signal peptidase II